MRAAVRALPGFPLSRAWIMLILAWLTVAAVLILRAGAYPAVMTGDEIWFAESAYQFLQHGIPQRLIHQDAVGSAQADFLPPVIMLVQAVSFLLFGLNPFGVAAQSVAVPLAAMLLVYAIARGLGASAGWAGFASLGVIGSQLFLRAGLYIRYEGLVAVCFLGYLLAGLAADRAIRKLPWDALCGALLCLAGLSYYPTAPFVALAALPFEWARWRDGEVRRLLPVAAGFAVPALAFGAYVAAFPAAFAAQVLGNGGDNYLTFELPRRLADLSFWRQARETLPEILGLIAVLAAGGWMLRAQPGPERRLLAAATILALPALIFPFQPRLLGLPVLLVLVLLALWAERSMPVMRRLARAGLLAGGAAAVVMVVLTTATVLLQHQARSYEPLATRLDRLMPLPGAAGIDQRAWLALRTHSPDRVLHHVMPVWAPGQVRIFEPVLLREPDGAASLRYLVLNAADAAETIAATPALASAFAHGDFVEIGRLNASFTPLPWASQPPYDLVVYARRN